MATDVDVQFFSHLNGLTLGNNWGDLIRLLDKALVTGLDFTQITAASIDTQGDVHITLYSAHNAMLFQVVELSGFTPASLNQKYRIKGVPNTTQLILKPALDITERSITSIGSGKLASLGYDIIFRDVGDVKRVYRAKNPTAQHPFIRVDETISDGVNNYTSTYAKYAMVGLLEHMEHIDDYENPDVLQLPFDPADPVKNWKISGTGSNVVRGWCRWHWARNASGYNSGSDSASPGVLNRNFTLSGDRNAFYMFTAFAADSLKQLLGCGLFDSAIDDNGHSQPWFMMGPTDLRTAGTNIDHTAVEGGWPLMYSESSSRFLVTDTSLEKTSHNYAKPILPHRRLDGFSSTNSVYPDEYRSGSNDIIQSGFFAMQIPFMDHRQLRGTLKHIAFAGGTVGVSVSTPIIQGNSIYVYDGSIVSSRGTGGCYFYLGELE